MDCQARHFRLETATRLDEGPCATPERERISLSDHRGSELRVDVMYCLICYEKAHNARP